MNKLMRKCWNIIKTYLEPWPVAILAAISLAYLWFSYKYSWPINLFYGVSVSIVSSYIFYFIVVKIKEVKDKRNIDPTITVFITRLVNKYDLTKKELNEGMDKLKNDSLSKTAPLWFNDQKANWFEYLLYSQKQLDLYLKQLTQLLPFLESSLVKEVVNLQDNPYFQYSANPGLPIDFFLNLFNELETEIKKIKKFI